MKVSIYIIIFFLFSSSEDIIGTYKIKSEYSGDTLELRKDGNYVYKSRGDSCWTWTDFTGKWAITNGTLILEHNYSYVEDATEYIEKINKENDSLKFEVKTKDGKPITHFVVNLLSANQESIQSQRTNSQGIVTFKKFDTIYDENEELSIKIEYLENGKESSENYYFSRNINNIIIKINNSPNMINKNDKYKFEVFETNLKAIEFPYAIPNSLYEKL